MLHQIIYTNETVEPMKYEEALAVGVARASAMRGNAGQLVQAGA